MGLHIALYETTDINLCECPVCGNTHLNLEREEIFGQSVTHNLSKMAQEAGLYTCLWGIEKLGIKKASELINPLSGGLSRLKASPDKFMKFNPSNGWGSYETFVYFVYCVLKACKKYPNADIKISP